jgi:hypothetical protein
MATMKTTAKTNPITGMATDNNPRREARQEKRQVRRDTRALNKNLNEGIKKEGNVKQYYTGVPVQGKTRLESRMEKYGIEPTAPVKGRSASMQKKIDRNKIKMAKDRIKGEKRQERNANPTKFDTFVMKTLGKGKYDKGSMKKRVVGEGSGGDPNASPKDASCKKAGK